LPRFWVEVEVQHNGTGENPVSDDVIFFDDCWLDPQGRFD